ncbi:MAG: hypothetical protein NT030_05020 [Candidatus Saganbacteria bacterium]|nr:hypothetical protein [Candidatus Saganbacteria bacterium]
MGSLISVINLGLFNAQGVPAKPKTGDSEKEINTPTFNNSISIVAYPESWRFVYCLRQGFAGDRLLIIGTSLGEFRLEYKVPRSSASDFILSLSDGKQRIGLKGFPEQFTEHLDKLIPEIIVTKNVLEAGRTEKTYGCGNADFNENLSNLNQVIEFLKNLRTYACSTIKTGCKEVK